MAATLNRQRASGSGAQGGGGYVIENSCRFNDNDSAYLRWTPSGTGDDGLAWTLSFWVKRGNITLNQRIVSSQIASGHQQFIDYKADDTFRYYAEHSPTAPDTDASWTTVAKYRDPTAWIHVVIVWDSANNTADDRIRFYKNGARVSPADITKNTILQNVSTEGLFHTAIATDIGRLYSGSTYFDGYLAEFVRLDGTASTDASEFGEYDSNGNWVPKEITIATDTGPVAIGQDVGTAIGNMTAGGNLAAAFDGNIAQASGAAAALGSGSPGYIGKNWGSTKSITKVAVFPSTGSGFASGTETITVKLLGHTSNAPGSATELHTLDIADPNTNGAVVFTPGTLTAFQYHWVSIQAASQGDAYVGELIFYEDGIPGFGTNGFHLDFAVAPGVSNGAGTDVSGNDNHFSESGLAANDQVSDSPTDSANDGIGNYATFNPLILPTTYSNGNLTAATTGNKGTGISTIAITPDDTGKYAAEFTVGAVGSASLIGICTDELVGTDSSGYSYFRGSIGTQYSQNNLNGTISYANDGTIVSLGATDSSAPATYTTGDVIRVEVDRAADTIQFFKGGADQVTIGSLSGRTAFGGNWFFCVGGIANTISANFGQQGFAGTPTSGFVGLNTANLPAPAIKDPTEHFAVKLYEGTGASQDIIFGNNTSMDPDLVWIKNRDAADNGHAVDSVRGATKRIPMIAADTSAVERTDGNGLDDFSVTDGFGLGSGAGVAGYNDNNESFASFSWKANGSGSSNEDGSINTTKTSANQTAGFSISTYTGTGANATVGHGLGRSPEVIWIKELSPTAGQWHEYNSHNNTSDPETDYRETLEGNTFTDDATFWQDTAPSSTVFSLGNNTKINGSTNTYVAYCWASIPGYSKMGIYTGNSSTNGTYVHCGFRPAFIIPLGIANANTYLSDHKRNGYNPENKSSFLDSSNAEVTSQVVDILSNGFKWRMSGVSNAGTYTFMAFAEHPFGGEGVSQARAR